MALLKDSASILKALALGKLGDVILDTNGAGILRANNAPLTGAEATASAAAMPVPTAAVVVVSGAVAITSIASGGKDGQTVTFVFLSTPTFTDGGNLKLSANLVATADDTITLRCYQDNWYEVARSVN